jgi:hypothetical protein
MLRHLTKLPGLRRLWRRFPVGSVPVRTAFDIWDRPHYAFGVFSAASLARLLGQRAITVIEFGVAGGNGLVALEDVSARVARHFGIDIAVVGFDTGTGMPAPRDYRDLPHVWRAGFYGMDVDKLRRRLARADLVLGNVAETIPGFLRRPNLPPVGFVAFDLDYYSSTLEAFTIFNGPAESRLPRVYCYFDDVIWPEHACYNDRIGELAAIREFNECSSERIIAQIANFAWTRHHAAAWNEQIYVFHDFEHPRYTQLITPEGDRHRERPLT